MKKSYLSILIIVLLFGTVAYVILSSLNKVKLPNANMSAMGSEMVKAKVKEIIEEGDIDLGGTVQRYQIARVELLEGKYHGIVMEMDYGKRQILSNNVYLRSGDTIMVTIGSRPDGVLTVYFVADRHFRCDDSSHQPMERITFSSQPGIQFGDYHRLHHSEYPGR